MNPPLLSIDFVRGIFRRYVGRSVYNGKPAMTHKREIEAEDWQEFREKKRILNSEDVENYRRKGAKGDEVASAPRPRSPYTPSPSRPAA